MEGKFAEMGKKLIFTVALVILTLAFFSENCLSADVEFISRTYLEVFEDTGDNTHAPLYEYVELNAKDLMEKKINFYSGGWVRYDLRSKSEDDRELDELSYAFVRYTPRGDRGLFFDIGRHLVFAGLASEQLDGISARWEITPRTGFALYGGVPVETDFDGRGGDLLYGGRVFQRIARKAEFGLSFLREDDEGSRYREEMGLDLWLRPVKKAEITGRSSYNTATDGWMEHTYNLRIFLLNALTLTGIFSRTDFDDAFSSRTLSVFSPEFLGRGETLTKAGVSGEYRVGRAWTFVIDFLDYEYETMGSADYYGLSVTGNFGISNKAGLSLHRIDGESERLAYTEYRGYARKRFGSFTASLDAVFHRYDRPFNDLNSAYSVNATAEYRITSSLTAGLSLTHAKDPDFTHDTRALLKLAYSARRR